jgi:hypothetical protein
MGLQPRANESAPPAQYTGLFANIVKRLLASIEGLPDLIEASTRG